MKEQTNASVKSIIKLNQPIGKNTCRVSQELSNNINCLVFLPKLRTVTSKRTSVIVPTTYLIF